MKQSEKATSKDADSNVVLSLFHDCLVYCLFVRFFFENAVAPSRFLFLVRPGAPSSVLC